MLSTLVLAVTVALALGLPSPDSVLNCPLGRLNANTVCTITVMSSPTQQSTAAASDFNVVVNGVIIIPTTTSGAVFTFPADTSSLGSYQIGVTLAKGGQLIVGGSVTYIVYGNPSADSLVSCPVGRFGISALCTITVQSSSFAASTAVASDFTVSVNGSPATLAPNPGSGSFTFKADTSALGTYIISAKLASGDVLRNGQISYTVVGSPTVDSTLACPTGRVGVETICKITVKSSSFQASTAFASDFTVSIAGITTSITSTDGGQTFTFPICTNNIGSFQILVTLGSGQAINGGSMAYTVYGIPDVSSTLTCVPGRYGVATRCTIAVKNEFGLTTTGFASDFVATVAGVAVTLTSTNGGTAFTFPTNTYILGTYNIVVTLVRTGSTIDNGVLSYTVYGNPTASSVLSCDSSHAQVAGDPIPCTLTIKNAGGSTTCPTSDLSIYFGGLRAVPELSTTNGGFAYSFLVPPPPSIRDSYVIAVSFPSFTKSVTFPIFGASNGVVSGAQSQISCAPINPRVEDVVSCTAISFNSAGAYTTATANDFSVSITQATGRRRAVVTPSTTDGGISYSFSMTLPSTPVALFSVTTFVKGIQISSETFRVSGVPTEDSTMACTSANQAAFVKISEIITCVVSPANANGPTTALVTDFDLIWNEDKIPINVSTPDYGASIVFTFPVPLTPDPDFVINAALSTDDSVPIADATFSILFECGGQCILPCLAQNECTNCTFGYNGTNCETEINVCDTENGGCGGNECIHDGPGVSHCSSPSASSAATVAGAGIGAAVAVIIIIILVVIFVSSRKKKDQQKKKYQSNLGVLEETHDFDVDMFTSIEQHLRTGSLSQKQRENLMSDLYDELPVNGAFATNFHASRGLYHEPAVAFAGRINPLFNEGYEQVEGTGTAFGFSLEGDGEYDLPADFDQNGNVKGYSLATEDDNHDGYLKVGGLEEINFEETNDNYLVVPGTSAVNPEANTYEDATFFSEEQSARRNTKKISNPAGQQEIYDDATFFTAEQSARRNTLEPQDNYDNATFYNAGEPERRTTKFDEEMYLDTDNDDIAPPIPPKPAAAQDDMYIYDNMTEPESAVPVLAQVEPGVYSALNTPAVVVASHNYEYDTLATSAEENGPVSFSFGDPAAAYDTRVSDTHIYDNRLAVSKENPYDLAANGESFSLTYEEPAYENMHHE